MKYKHVNVRIYMDHPFNPELIVVRNQEYLPYNAVDIRMLFKALYIQRETIRDIKVEPKEGGLLVGVVANEYWRPIQFGLRKHIYRIPVSKLNLLEEHMSNVSKYHYREVFAELAIRH